MTVPSAALERKLARSNQRPAWKEKASAGLTAVKGLVLGLFAIAIIIPILVVISTSVASEEQLADAGGYVLWPSDPTLAAYKALLTGPLMFRALGVSLFITVVGTLIALFVTITMAYATSRKVLFGRPVIMLVLFTLLFAPGLIPSFLMVRQLGLLDTVWSLILPGVFAAFNFVVMRAFFMNIPRELIESAQLDGASDWQILCKIVLPLSKAVVAVVGLFYAVGFWNSFFNALLYVNDQNLWPVQLILRSYVIQGSQVSADQLGVGVTAAPQSIKMAVVVIALVPICALYPFLQRHFTKGVITGAVKG